MSNESSTLYENTPENIESVFGYPILEGLRPEWVIGDLEASHFIHNHETGKFYFMSEERARWNFLCQFVDKGFEPEQFPRHKCPKCLDVPRIEAKLNSLQRDRGGYLGGSTT